MQAFITAFQTTFTTDALWGDLAAIAVLLGTLVIFAFGYRLLKRAITGASKGKAKM